MAKADTAKLIQEANGATVDPEAYTQAQLNTLLGLAKGEDKDAFQKKVAEFDEANKEDESEPTLTVKVNPEKGSGSYLHPVSKQAILRGGKAVSVPDDAWTQDMVARRFLLEARK